MDRIVIICCSYRRTDPVRSFGILEWFAGTCVLQSSTKWQSATFLSRAAITKFVFNYCAAMLFSCFCRTRLMESLRWSRLHWTVTCCGPTAQPKTTLKICPASRLLTLATLTWGNLMLALTWRWESSTIFYLKQWWAGKNRTSKTLQTGRHFLESQMSSR